MDDPLFMDFKKDVERVQNVLELFESLKELHGVAIPGSLDSASDDYQQRAMRVHSIVVRAYSDTVVLVGVQVLYLAGRFENFVRTVFEELCDRVATRCGSFDKLPKKMKASLLEWTAEVIARPRKYGHGDKNVEQFAKFLAANLADKSASTPINSRCLSITNENMRADTIKELFDRIDANDIWERISQQSNLQVHLETADAAKARRDATERLNAFMQERNQIAHPSGSISFPDAARVRDYADFLLSLAEALLLSSRAIEMKYINGVAL